MNIFIIPSWYPSQAKPIGGIFIREQAEAIAELCPNFNVIVSTWGQGSGEISARYPWRFLKVLQWRLCARSNKVRQLNGVWEIFNPVLHWSRRLPFGGAKQLIEVNRRNFQLATERFGKIDLIHAHISYPAGYIASVISSEVGIPYIVTEHMGPFPFVSLMQKGRPIPEISRAFENATATIAVSPSLAKRVSSFGYQEPVVIPNAVDERAFYPGKSSSEKFVFFTLCGLTNQKGIDHLLESIAFWNPPADCFEFRIGGDGPMRETYQAMAQHLGISDRVKWLGHVGRDEAPELFRNCHVFVMPSRHETFGVVYAEAIASGKPVIATRCGGPESIVNETNGRLVDVGDISGLSDAMKEVSASWEKFDPAAIRQDFERRFSRPAVVGQLRALYETVVRG